MSNPIKPNFKTEWFCVSVLIMAFITGLYFVQNFPARVPTHWNLEGQINGYSGAFSAAFLLPFLMLGIYVMFLLLPHLDPKKEQYSKFVDVYHEFKDLIIAFMFIMYIMTGLNALGYIIDMALYVPILVGILFAALGFLLRNIKTNWFLGIRTPWTLSSEIVWDKTHRLSGPVFIIAGVLMAATGFVAPKFKITLFILAIAIIVLLLPLYSYILFLKEKKHRWR